LGLANARGNRWCLAFCGAMGLAALSTSGLIYQSAQASIVPWVVEVDETGAVKASGPAHNDFKPSDAQIAHQLARFISNVRSVSIDPVVLRENWSEDSFEIRWREKSFRGGALLEAQTYTASLSIITKAPTDAETLHRNPLGLYIHGLHWSKDLNATGASQ